MTTIVEKNTGLSPGDFIMSFVEKNEEVFLRYITHTRHIDAPLPYSISPDFVITMDKNLKNYPLFKNVFADDILFIDYFAVNFVDYLIQEQNLLAEADINQVLKFKIDDKECGHSTNIYTDRDKCIRPGNISVVENYLKKQYSQYSFDSGDAGVIKLFLNTNVRG